MGLLDLIFGKSKPKYPVITNDMLQPVENKISTTDAKRITKQLFLQIGYCEDAQDARFEAESLADSIRYHEEGLRDELEMLKDEFDGEMNEWNDDLSMLKDEVKQASDSDKDEAKVELAEHQESKPDGREYLAVKQRLADFKSDKRAFLITYINEQLHGQTGDADD